MGDASVESVRSALELWANDRLARVRSPGAEDGREY